MLPLKSPTKNRYQNQGKKPLFKTLFVILFIAVLAAVIQLLPTGRTSTEAGNQAEAVLPRPAAALPTLEPGIFQRSLDWLAGLRKSADEVRKGESFSVVFDRLGLNASETRLITQAAAEVMDVTKVRPGLQVAIYREKKTNEPVRLELSRDKSNPLVLLKTPSGYVASWQESSPVVCTEASAGSIKSSLWVSAVNVYGLDPELVLALTDIFAYDIDFFTDIRDGDSFRILYEKKYCDGIPKGVGRIMAAEFVNGGQTLEAFYYENSKGEGGYYDQNGRSLRKMFLKSPLQYRRISSYFSKSRLHPILKIRRPHLGVDYAAPTGTPVEALGDGIVVFRGWKGGYGNYVEIKHSQGYQTCYGHLSKFAAGLKTGDRVKQGQLVGYVGSTGLSSGPHLDFRVKKNKTFIDPLSLKLDPAPPIVASEKSNFAAQRERLQSEMRNLLARR